MELQVYQVDGSETGRTIALDASVFGIEPNDHVLWLDVRRTQASRRQGTHKTKERGEIAGSMRKLYRQKGTGMARSGTVKSPLRRGGGRVFGPRPRTYGLRLTKKTRRLARRSALSYKAREDALRVVEAISFEAPNTRQLAEMIEALDLAGRKVLVLTAKAEGALYQSSRNLAKVRVREARSVSSEEVLGAAVIIFEEGALDVLTETLSGASSAQRSVGEAEEGAEAAVSEAAEAVAEAEEAVAEAAAAEAVAEAEEAVAAEAEVAAEAAEAVAEAEEAVAAEAEEATAEAEEVATEAVAEAEEAVAAEAEEATAEAEEAAAEAEEAVAAEAEEATAEAVAEAEEAVATEAEEATAEAGETATDEAAEDESEEDKG